MQACVLASNLRARRLALAIVVAAVGLTRAPASSATAAYTWHSVFPWPTSYGNPVVYDARRQRVFMYPNWEWNGTKGTWAQLSTPSTLPMSANLTPPAAYDTTRNLTVLLSPTEGFWERNGDTGAWTLRGGPQPALTYATQMIYDPDLARFLIVARDNAQPPDRIWEWDPATGTLTETAQTGPQPTPTRTGAAMAYDAGRRRLVMFGGFTDPIAPDYTYSYIGDVWEWNPATGTWASRPTTGPAPSAREAALAAYHSGRGHVFVFGGQDANWAYDSKTGLADLWEWDGTAGAWIQHTLPSGSPEPAGGPLYSLTYDGARGRLVIFGGQGDRNTNGEVWKDVMEWDDTAGAWDDRRPPSGRDSPAMAYDPASGRVMMFSGYAAATSYPDDLWAWNGADQTWSRRDLAGPPPSRYYAAMAADEGRGTLVLCCGSGLSYWYDTWELNAVAGTWTSRTPSANVPGGRYGTLVYDSKRGKIYLYGGGDTVVEWDGTAGTWTWQTATGTKPSSRSSPRVAFDAARDRLVAFGGYPANSPTFLDDTWEWNPADGSWAARAPAGSMPAGHAYVAAYDDTLRSRVVLLGGTYSNVTTLPIDTAWEWDGVAGHWTAISIAADPVSGTKAKQASWPGIAFDSARGVAVTFGGSSLEYLHETWELGVTCPAAPAPCVASVTSTDGGITDAGGRSDGGDRTDGGARDAAARPDAAWRPDAASRVDGAGHRSDAGTGDHGPADAANDAPVVAGRDAASGDGPRTTGVDAARDTSAPASASGCSCRASGAPAGAAWPSWQSLLAILAFVVCRRRRRKDA